MRGPFGNPRSFKSSCNNIQEGKTGSGYDKRMSYAYQPIPYNQHMTCRTQERREIWHFFGALDSSAE